MTEPTPTGEILADGAPVHRLELDDGTVIHYAAGGRSEILGRAPARTWTFDDVTVTDVIDGDTIIATVRSSFDFGFKVAVAGESSQRFRLARCNAPELHNPDGTDNPAGVAARTYVAGWLGLPRGDSNLRIVSLRPDDYGRWVAEVIDRRTGENLSDALLAAGQAAPWPAVKP